MKRTDFPCDDDAEIAGALRDAEVALSGALVARILVHDANNMLNVILATVTASQAYGMADETRSILVEATQKLASILRRLGAHQRPESHARPISVSAAIGDQSASLVAAEARTPAIRLKRPLTSISRGSAVVPVSAHAT